MDNVFVHKTALVESNNIGENTKIWAFAHIMSEVIIGSNCNIGDHCFLENGVVIGNNVTIKNGNLIFEGANIEDGVFIGPNVIFTNDLYPRSPRIKEAEFRYNNKDWLSGTVIKFGASLGAGCVIVAGNEIGRFATVGAGAVVTRDVSDHALVVGNPARQVGWVCQCGAKLIGQKDLFVCKLCSKTYSLVDKKLVFCKS